MTPTTAVKDRVDRWMFEAYALDVRSLGVARIFVAVYLVLYRPADIRWLARVPSSFFRPAPGPLRLLHGIPSTGALDAIAFALSLATVALLVGYHTRVASCAAGILLFLVDGLGYSFGHVHHSGTFLAAVLVVMSASGWGGAYSLDALRRGEERPIAAPAWPLALAAFLLGFLMLTAALPKLATGWLDPSVLAVRAHIVHMHFVAPGTGHLASFALRNASSWVWKPLDYVTLVLEGSFIVAAASPRATRLFCAAAVVFHLGVFLGFNIEFTGNIVAYAVFFPWALVVDRLPRAHAASSTRAIGAVGRLARSRLVPLAAVAAGATVLYFVTRRVGAPARYLAARAGATPGEGAVLAVFAVAVPLAVAYLGGRLRRAARAAAFASVRATR